MNLIVWNCRGTALKGFADLVKYMKREYNASLIALLETHTSGSQAMRIAKRICFENQFIKDARGQTRGIWLLWDSTYLNIKVLNDSSQIVHVEVSVNNDRSWFISIVYGSPHYSQRQSLWDEIQEIHTETNGD